MGTSETLVAVLIEARTWELQEADAARSGHPVWGLDLGTSAAQCAVAAYWPLTGRLECMAAFPSIPGLAERGLRDGVGNLYRQMAKAGELIVTGGQAADIAELLDHARARFGEPRGIVCDRWRAAELYDALNRAGIETTVVMRGQGFKDGAEDVRDFRRALLEQRCWPVPSLLMRTAMSEARVVTDPAGNQKLAKHTEGGRRMRARDDAAAATILAVAAGDRARRLDAETEGAMVVSV